jgi:hypothetical protein
VERLGIPLAGARLCFDSANPVEPAVLQLRMCRVCPTLIIGRSEGRQVRG